MKYIYLLSITALLPAAAPQDPKKQPEKFEVVLNEEKKIKIEFVRIKAGSFAMSEPKLARQVTLTKDYWIQTTEVTQAQWQALMEANPSYFRQLENAAELPVEQVSWDDCQKYLEKLNAKLKDRKATLPTEAEWEFACRAGTDTKWCFGDERSKVEHCAWYDNNSTMETHPVAKKKPNAWGLFDMHGNVWEWCQDWHGDLSGGNVSDPAGPEKGTERVVRGGGFESGVDETRSANRKGADPSTLSKDGSNKEIGFRVALRDAK